VTALLAGLRADELVRANIGDIRPTNVGAVIHVRGKGEKDRRIPIEAPMVGALTKYLDSRAARFPGDPQEELPPWGIGRMAHVSTAVHRRKRRPNLPRHTAIPHPASVPASRHLQSPRPRSRHTPPRHTFATALANAEVDVYTLMNLLGHELMVTSQRYVTAAGTETRKAAASNRLYDLIN
jgi:integrase